MTAVATGLRHSLALKTDGTVVVWGDNYYHQCDVPAAIQGKVVAVAANADLCLALQSDGTVSAWGSSVLCTVPPGLNLTLRFQLPRRPVVGPLLNLLLGD